MQSRIIFEEKKSEATHKKYFNFNESIEENKCFFVFVIMVLIIIIVLFVFVVDVAVKFLV